MFILLTLGIFILKFLALGVVALFFIEDLDLTQSANTLIYGIYTILGICTFASLFFFILGKKLLWLIISCVLGALYIGMYNSAPDISEIHREHDLKSRYFKDTSTFFARMNDVLQVISKDKQ